MLSFKFIWHISKDNDNFHNVYIIEIMENTKKLQRLYYRGILSFAFTQHICNDYNFHNICIL